MRPLAALMALLCVACSADPGSCDEAAAYEVYYDQDGFPAYAGQALVEVSCGQGRYCHASDIPADARFGAPAGLDLDIGVAADPTELSRLAHARRVAWNLRGEVLWQVDIAAMPPGPPSGEEALAGAPSYRTAIGTPAEHALPTIGSTEAREMLRNWLACGAHVVEATEGSSTGIGDIVPAIAVLRCPEGALDCGGICLPVESDPVNCGACGRSCGPAQQCIGGMCTCASDLVACGSDCADLSSSVRHCGTCETDCGALFCASSSCTSSCPTGTTDCGGSCVDPFTSSSDCGGCGRSCRAGEACTAGVCTCTGGLTSCDGRCVDLSSTSSDCGACGASCGDGESCSAGSCTCAPGSTDCGGRCVDSTRDAANCGGCGTSCGVGGSCVDGSCVSCGGDVSFAADIVPIFTRSCLGSGCHEGARAAASLNLSATQAWAELVGTPASCGTRALVRPSDVSGSYLVNKLENVDICSGTEMPKRGERLPTAEIDLIRAWICQGAAND
jgi:hypothetical protein